MDNDEKKDSEVARATADLARAREEFALSMGALEHKITRSFEWREWIRRRPHLAVAVAFGLGFLLGRSQGRD